MKPFYKIIILAFLILALSVSLNKPIYESYYSINDYKKLGCNGNTLDMCVIHNGMSWCEENCRDAASTSKCNSDTWDGCLKKNSQKWCQDNCKVNNKLYTVGIRNISK